MRYVPVNCVREGMLLARPLLGKNDALLLNSGTLLKNSYIRKIAALGYSGVYIDDDLSDGITIDEVIDPGLRFRVVRTIKSTFMNMKNDENATSKNLDVICDLVSDMLDQILAKKHIMVNMIDLKMFDDYTFYHSVNVTVLSMVTATTLNLDKNKVHDIGITALLHDIGKVFIPKEILNKKGPLDNKEFDLVKTHSAKGYEFVKKYPQIPVKAYSGILQHHERYDGTGYPNGLDKDNISLFGRIIAVTDVYDALTSDRPYRKALKPSDSIEYIMGGSSTLFDPETVTAFIHRISPYPIGTAVLLSNNTKGIVVKNYSDACLRPRIKIVMEGSKKETPYFVDLKNDSRMKGVVIEDITAI